MYRYYIILHLLTQTNKYLSIFYNIKLLNNII